MFPLLSVRIASVTGLFLLALFTAGLISLPSFQTTASAGLSTTKPAPFVNRARKGDRLPIAKPIVAPGEFGFPASPVTPLRAPIGARKIPPGCDPAFSPISSPLLANVYRRCIT